jgi:hypothetical protein
MVKPAIDNDGMTQILILAQLAFAATPTPAQRRLW